MFQEMLRIRWYDLSGKYDGVDGMVAKARRTPRLP